MTVRLEKSRTILTRYNRADPDMRSWYRSSDEETGVIHRDVYISQQDFEDFGEPDVITVTVEPGDHLNQ